jgi:hypothetical protein
MNVFESNTMKTLNFIKSLGFIAVVAVGLSGCQYEDDPGPLQQQEAEYTILDFDRLDMGDALSVTVTQGTEYSMKVTGDRRNIEDLVVKRSGSTLEMHYRNMWRPIRRQHKTYVTIVMPGLVSADFSGAVTSEIIGFEADEFHLGLSGASTCTLKFTGNNADFDLSGASDLAVEGSAANMNASLSGASRLSALNFPVQTARLDLTGASRAQVNAAERLKATASGASDITYRGTPLLDISTSGESHVRPDDQ